MDRASTILLIASEHLIVLLRNPISRNKDEGHITSTILLVAFEHFELLLLGKEDN